jgi:preprotein translocase subunit SecA
MFDFVNSAVKKVFGDANERSLRKLHPKVAKIATFEEAMQSLSDDDLAAKTAEFRQKLDNGASLDDVACEAFATVREVAQRTVGMRHYDCQMVGGLVLHNGTIAEMKTGEGKTLTATLPMYLNALPGKGTHLITVNDYLAARDAEWMAPVYNFLGLEVGTILSSERDTAYKRRAYAADVTYGTNNEFGFDYLRDNMKFRLEDYVQRGHIYGIIDEVDSILIDEARTPLIISGPVQGSIDLYRIVDAVIPLLQREIDFAIDEKAKNITLTDEGITSVEKRLGIDNLYDDQNMLALHHVTQSLKAHHLFKRDRDYVVRNGEVVIVDEFTGRLMHGRRWSDGLHQSVEAKEKVKVQEESQTYASITYQNLFRMYEKLSGMTGTAATEAAEFASIYDLDTLVIPTNKPVIRKDDDDIVFKTQMEKFRAVIGDIRERHAVGQPILVGTTSVEKSEILSRLLDREEIVHEVLNAKPEHQAREALIVAQAGRLGSVTISTNMAGRGTDIKLGGNPEEFARLDIDPLQDADGYATRLAEYITRCKGEQVQVLDAGGLHIIGTERHESRRVDNQLRGRSGRQGDPGSSRFYLSLEDDLLRIFGSDKITIWMERMGLQDDEPIEHRWITRAIENAQKKVEGYHFNVRKNLLEYDDVMNYQRKAVYDLRRRALEGEGIHEMVKDSVVNVVDDVFDDFLSEGVHPEQWEVAGLRENIQKVFDIEWPESDAQLRDFAREELRQRLLKDGLAEVESKRASLDEEVFQQVSRMLILELTDQLWKDHLLAMDRLRQGVGLRGYGQRNPLLEYKREAYHMFLMMSAMRDELMLTRLVRAQLAPAAAAAALPSKAMARNIAAGGLEGRAERPVAPSAPTPGPVTLPAGAAARLAAPSAPAAPTRPSEGVEAYQFALDNNIKRNDPCPCGSGKKFKKCCYKYEKDIVDV